MSEGAAEGSAFIARCGFDQGVCVILRRAVIASHRGAEFFFNQFSSIGWDPRLAATDIANAAPAVFARA
jgi:hypothetical protein